MKIENINIKNFKSLRNIDIDLSNLTLITGVNSSGKSSFIQTLLLLKQNEGVFNSVNKNTLAINGEYIKLGNKKDILFEDVYEEDIEITISGKNIQDKVVFNNKNLQLSKDTNVSLIGITKTLNIFNDDFQYIMTDRIAPSITYGLSDENIERNLIGFRGEYTAHYLAEKRHKSLEIDELRHKKSITSQLLENVSLWLSEISSGIDISATVYNELQQVNLAYSYTYGTKKTDKYSALNVGFGITYVLPIIVSLLKAKVDDLIIIENPESHLHPAGQVKIAELCAIASANGVQIIVETHSDHFLNGIRVATKKEILKPEQSKIYYFSKHFDQLETKIEMLHIDNKGKIDNWPKGFFDEYSKQLDELLW